MSFETNTFAGKTTVRKIEWSKLHKPGEQETRRLSYVENYEINIIEIINSTVSVMLSSFDLKKTSFNSAITICRYTTNNRSANDSCNHYLSK